MFFFRGCCLANFFVPVVVEGQQKPTQSLNYPQPTNLLQLLLLLDIVSWPSQELNNQFWIKFIGWLLSYSLFSGAVRTRSDHVKKANHECSWLGTVYIHKVYTRLNHQAIASCAVRGPPANCWWPTADGRRSIYAADGWRSDATSVLDASDIYT